MNDLAEALHALLMEEHETLTISRADPALTRGFQLQWRSRSNNKVRTLSKVIQNPEVDLVPMLQDMLTEINEDESP